MTDFVKGQTVTFARDTRADSASGYGNRMFTKGQTGRVTAVRRVTITISIPNPSTWSSTKRVSFNVPRDSLRASNGEQWDAAAVKAAIAAKPKPRKLGETPEGMIAPDDPRLAWLWEDAAKYADKSGYCSYYDRISNELGIPGRERKIQVTVKVNGLDVTTTVTARSTAQAEAIVHEKLGITA